MDMKELRKQQKEYFFGGETLDEQFRMDALNRLEAWIVKHEMRIQNALYADLHKAPLESYFSEIGMVLSELRYMKKHLHHWMKRQYVKTPLAQFYSRSFIQREPYGVVLIMAPWNYPFMLSIHPLIGAIAAGNCAMIKPSAYAAHTSALLKKMIDECFSPSYIAVVEGGRKENAVLLEEPFDFIFFTGSVAVGKLVMEKASKHLTPVILELGGKSPCIIDETANLRVAAKRIVFGKFLNSAQTCVAPDYVFVHRKVHDTFVSALNEAIRNHLGKHPLDNKDYPKMINQHHFERVMNLIKNEEQLIGGEYKVETQQIAPTIISHASLQAPYMEEEIFGPILPCIAYQDINEVIQYLQKHDKPLALYMFGKSSQIVQQVLDKVSFGGGCVNDTIIHLASSKLPFGGIGSSGMGQYHGLYSYEAFSHKKSIVNKATWIDLPFRYHPYSKQKEKWIRKFMK